MLNSYAEVRISLNLGAYVRILTSSIAITTSTVSKLSNPRSFEKCEVGESYSMSISSSWKSKHSVYLGCIGNLQKLVIAS